MITYRRLSPASRTSGVNSPHFTFSSKSQQAPAFSVQGSLFFSSFSLVCCKNWSLKMRMIQDATTTLTYNSTTLMRLSSFRVFHTKSMVSFQTLQDAARSPFTHIEPSFSLHPKTPLTQTALRPSWRNQQLDHSNVGSLSSIPKSPT